MPLLTVENIKKVFQDKNGDTNEVIKDFSCIVEEGEFVSILGPSGCGKTTLLSMIGGFQKWTAGRITLDGKEIKGPCVERGYVFQNYALFPWMNVKNNILYSLKMKKVPKKEQGERLLELLKLAHLEGHEKKYPIQLSGGMQQRVAVLRALAGRPRILLFDEPLGAVDFQMREIMQNELESIITNAYTTVVMVTHDVAESVFLSDRVLVMKSNGGDLLGDVRIALDMPRDRTSQEFKNHVNNLTDLVRKAFDHKTKPLTAPIQFGGSEEMVD